MLTGAYLLPVAGCLAVLALWHGVRHRQSRVKTIARVLLLLYLGWLLAATLFPVPIARPDHSSDLKASVNRPNAIPLAGIRQTLDVPGVWPRVRLLAGNVLVFVPFGLLLPLAVPRLRRARSVFLAGVLLSGGIELAQLGISLLLGTWYRMSDIDDVLLNVAGVMLGWILSRLSCRWWPEGRWRSS